MTRIAKERITNRLLNLSFILFLVAASLLASTVYVIYWAWQDGKRQSRASAVSEMIATKTAHRPTESPGVSAWIRWLLRNRTLSADADGALYRRVIDATSPGDVPGAFASVLDLLRTPIQKAAEDPGLQYLDAAEFGLPTDDPLELRCQQFASQGGEIFVITRRRALVGDPPTRPSESDRFLQIASTHLRSLKQTWHEEPDLGEVRGIGPCRVARIYALGEDGTFVSLPLGRDPSVDPRSLARREGLEFRREPELPTFGSPEFFFSFRYRDPLRDQASYSGLYLDLGGLGFVATVVVPVRFEPEGLAAIVAADIAFDVDWQRFAAEIESPMVASIVSLDEETAPHRWQPWNAIEGVLDKSEAPPELKEGVSELASRERREKTFANRKSVHHSFTLEGDSAVAIQLSRSTWLALFVPSAPPRLPWIILALCGVQFMVLLLWIDRNRRRASLARKVAQDELTEKQNLLGTMNVPLIVVDPNTDSLVYCNDAASRLGIREGFSFSEDVVAADEAAREHYHHMNALDRSPRRAYGVPIRIRREDGTTQIGHAIVRSVAVTAPIPTWFADERHRLGILFLLQEDADLALYMKERDKVARRDERYKLSSLLSHGVDALVRTLHHELHRSRRESSPELIQWLSEYVEQRVRLVAWLLDHWERERPEYGQECVVELPHVVSTLERHRHIFHLVREDAELRSRLRWDNGALSTNSGSDAFEQTLDWPPEYCFTIPAEGAFGLFLSEALINAIKHGAPGSSPLLEIQLDRTRSELHFTLTNASRGEARDSRSSSKAFGGRAIMERLVALSGWEGLRFEESAESFRVTWVIRVSRRKDSARSE